MKTTELSRRNFIKSSAGFFAAAGAIGSPYLMQAAPQKPWLVGCRDVHLRVAGAADSWSAMDALGAEGVEVQAALDLTCPNLFHPEHKYTLAAADGIKRLRDDLAAKHCRITAFMMANRFDEQLDKELESARGLVRAAGQLGVEIIRIDVVPRKLNAQEFLPFAIKACQQLCEVAADSPVRFGVENHGKITNDPDFLDKLFAGVGSPKLGLTLDCANFYWWGHPLRDLYAIYERVAPHVVHTHCKSIRYPADQKHARREMGWEYAKYCCPVYEGDIDFKRLVKILRKAGYRGDLCVENESLSRLPEAERGAVVKKEIAFLKQLA